MLKVKVLCVVMVLLAVPVVWSGQISPYLADRMQGMIASEQIDVIVMMQEQADIGSLNRQLKLERSTLADRNRRVIEALQDIVSRTQPAMSAYLDELQLQGLIERYKMLWIANMFIVTANKAGIEAIAANPEIADLYFNYTIESIKPIDAKESDPPLIASHEIGLERINALEAWAAGFTGAGRVVANMDTGVDGTHPALADRFRGDVDGDGDVDESWYDPYAGWTFPQDSQSHGTHTMGTICGRTPSGDTIGVAIDAQWIAAAPIDRYDIARTVADALLSFEWFVDPDGDPYTQDNPDACGNSWGIPDGIPGYPDCDETFWVVIDNLEAAGTVVIFSAGNEGYSGLRSPADRATTYYNCFSVGAVDGATPSLPVANFSARGPTECAEADMAIKPEVVAPGVNVRSSIPGGGYSTKSGTSMSSPHITGAVAVIRSANPDLDVESIKEIMMSTAVDLGPAGEDNSYGHGIIDLHEACLIAQAGYGAVEGYVYDENSSPVGGARIVVEGSTRFATADDVGFYHLSLPGDSTYTLIASFFGHLPDTATVTILPDETVTQDFTLDFAEYGILHGHVLDLDSNPIEDAIISVVGVPLNPVYTNNEGYYIFDNIPGGETYDIEATAIGYGLGRGSIFVPVGDTVALDFDLRELESFEANNGGWVGEGVWEWGAPSSGPGEAYDGNNVWATVLGGSYPNNADDPLYTTFYDITDANASFSFYHWYNMELNWDGGNIHISTDGGTSWNLITPEDGYPNPDVRGLDDEPGFSGETGVWEQVLVDLSSYQDEIVKFKLRFGTDGSATRDGWYIDGAVVNGGSAVYPEAGVSPLAFNVQLNSGESTTGDLTISNSGGAPLNFSVVVLTDDFMQSMNTFDSEVEIPVEQIDVPVSKEEANAPQDESHLKTEIDPPFNHDVITDFGGPDEFGYTYIDSDEPDGPSYEWIDITGNGTPVDFSYGSIDDGYTDLFPMGLTFTFYGQTYSDIMVSTNGWLSFIQYASSYISNYTIPRVYIPNALIAVQWDDLDGGATGNCYYYYDDVNNRFIVSWVDWHYYPDLTTPLHSFQVILDGNDNSIRMQYGEIEGEYQSDITIGIENEVGEIGLEYAYNNAVVQPGLAIEFTYPLFWLTVSPQEGIVQPSESMELDVVFDATELENGLYTGNILISTNDPEHNTFTLPCTLEVGETGIGDDMTAVPATFSLTQNYPNPFNPTTDIAFGLPADGHTTLEVYDIMGRKVKTLVDGNLPAGVHQITWDSADENGNHVASGVYFYKLVQGDNVTTKKMMMVK